MAHLPQPITTDRLPVPNFPGYAVTRDGRIISLERRIRGGVGRIMHEQELAQMLTSSGYLKVVLWRDRKPHHLYVHQIVIEAFKPRPPHTTCTAVAHQDGNIRNNHADNLLWCDQSTYEAHTRHYDGRYFRHIVSTKMHGICVAEVDEHGNILRTFSSVKQAVTTLFLAYNSAMCHTLYKTEGIVNILGHRLIKLKSSPNSSVLTPQS